MEGVHHRQGRCRQGGGSITYVLSFPWVMKMVRCPVPGCTEVAHIAGQTREHFMYRHFFACIAMVQEGGRALPHCDLYSMHMSAGRLFKHQQTKWCDRNTQMRWQRKEVAIASRCEGVMFRITREEDVECIEGVETFKYLGRILNQSDDDWPDVIWNFGKARRVWNRLGKLLLREGAEPRVSTIFYQAVVHTVLLFGAKTWVFPDAMSRNLEGLHVGFLRRITGQRQV